MKWILLLSVAVEFAAVAANPPSGTNCAPLPPGVVSWWKANGDAHDSIDGNSGQSPNGVGFQLGVSGYAFEFNGTNQYIEVGDSPSLDLTNVLTIEFWVKRLRLDLPASPYADYIIEKGGDWTRGAQNYAVALHNPQYNYALHFLFANGWRGGGSIADTNWHHCAVVARNGDADPTLYIDGVQQTIVYREGAATIDLHASGLPLHIGAQIDTNYNYFSKTLIDELAIYNRALSNSEIQAIYNAGSLAKCDATPPPCQPPPPGLVSWWAGQGNTVDSVGTNHGTPAGDVTYATGKVGKGFVLAGTSDAVVVGNPTNLQLQNFTIETWIRRADSLVVSFGSHEDALLFGYGSGGYGLGLWNDGRLFLTRVDVDNVTVTNAITDTLFHHVAVTKSNDTVVFYLDGISIPAPPYDPGFTFSSDAAIGARADTMNDSFYGTIDEVSVYNRPLSSNEILAIYNASAAGKCRAPTSLTILTGPKDYNGFVGDRATLSVIAVAENPLTYQWVFNGTNVPGATSASLVLSNLQTNNAGIYFVIISDGTNTIGSDDATVFVAPQPPCAPRAQGIVSWWQGQGNAFDAVDNNNGTLVGNVVFAPGRVGNAFRFDGMGDAVSIGNNTNLQLQDFTIETWIRRADPEIATLGSHGTALLFGFGSLGYGFGMYNDGRLFLTRVDVNNVAVNTALTDTNNFHHVAVTKTGTTVVFYLDGLAYPAPPYDVFFTFSSASAIGARVDTLDDGFLGIIDEPAVYNRALSAAEILAIYNAAGSGKCKEPRPPVIVTQPASRTNYSGETVTFSVVATGDLPLSYQWQFNSNNIAGALSSSLTLAKITTNNAGNFSVIVSNVFGSIRSSNALLTVLPPPPCVPVPPGLVSWWRGDSGLIDSWDSNDGIQSSYSPLSSPGLVGNAFNFNARYFEVPDSPSLHLTQSLSFEAWINPSTAGTGAKTILDKTVNITLVRDPVILPGFITDGGYYLGLTNNNVVLFSLTSGGLQSTNRALLTTQSVPTNQWTFLVATYDGTTMRIYLNGVLSAATNNPFGSSTGTGELFIGGDPSSIIYPYPPPYPPRAPFNGLIDELSIYNRALNPDEIQAIYNAVVSGKCLVPAVITQQPQSQSVPRGEDVRFTVGVTGTRPLSYQWRFNGTPLFGATSSALLLERLETNRAGLYSVLVSNSLGGMLSSNAVLTILPPPVCVPTVPGLVSWWPADGNGIDAAGTNNATVTSPATFSTGKNGLAFSLLATSRTLGALIQVSNSASLNFGSNVDFSIEGWVKVTATNKSATNMIVSKIIASPTAAARGYSLFLANGHLGCSLGASATYGPFLSDGADLRDGMFHHVAAIFNRSTTNGARLYVDGQSVLSFDLSGRRGSTENTSAFLIAPSAATGFDSLVTNLFTGLIDELAVYNRALTSDEVLAIRQAGAAGKCKVKPFIITQPASQRVNVGSNVTFSVVAGGNSPLRYQWLRNGAALAGATNSSVSFAAQLLPTSQSYSVRVTNAFGFVLSSNAVLVVNTAPIVSNTTVTLNEDTPTSITLTAIDSQADPLTYTVTTGPAHGTLTGQPPNLTYTPAQNYNGPDGFSFKANDGMLDSATATVSITVLPVNDPPVAAIQVGPLFSLTPGDTNLVILSLNNTNAQVILDGSGSTDVENDPLSFTWLEGTNLIGSGMALTSVFNVNPHTVTLQVYDGQDTGSTSASFEVVRAGDSVRDVIGMVQLSGLASQTWRPLQSTLKAAASAFDSGNVGAAINILQAFQNKVRAQVQPTDPVLAQQLIDAAQQIINSLSAP